MGFSKKGCEKLKAKNRDEFKQVWYAHIDDLVRLVPSFASDRQVAMFEEIKKIQAQLKILVDKAAVDAYGYQ